MEPLPEESFQRPRVVVTADGSHTLYDEVTGEHYHSVRGALTESRHVFIESGYRMVAGQNEIFHVYETGLGTGLNALLTSVEARKERRFIHYHACELYPISPDIAEKLNYPGLIGCEWATSDFQSIHASPYNGEPHRVHKYFVLSKHQCSFTDMQFFDEQMRLVYYDAFSSGSQPGLWQTDVFSKLARAMLPGAVLVTYSAAGTVKSALRQAGFRIQRLPGAAGKREMLRAIRL